MTSGTGFCEIGAKTNFSFLEGAARPEEMVFAASALGLSGLGIADRNSVAGVVRAFTKARDMKARFERAKEIGPEAVLKEDPEPIFEPVRLQYGARLVFSDKTPDVLAYPQNRKGWANLCRLLSRGNLRTEKGSCILEEWDFWEWCDEMMLAVVPDFSRAEDTGYQTHLKKCLVKYRERFGRKIYLALSPTYDGRDAFVFAAFAQIADECDVPLIATNLPLFHFSYRRPLSDVVTAIREHVTVQEAGFRFAANGERHIKQSAEMARLFSAYPQAITNTERFFRQLDFSLEELKHNYPDESVEGETPFETLKRLTHEGARGRYGVVPEEIENKIAYELDLIRQKDYAPYFLTVRNIMEFARGANILCQGRGSAANSTVCYCLRITDVDPRKISLLFDRFLSTNRDEPPDIDVDFEHAKREEVIQHIYRTYGYRNAGLTAAVTSYRTRMAGREVAKAFGLSEDVQAALSSTVWGWSEEGTSEREAKAAGLDVKDPITKKVLSHSQELMGFPRHLTQHVGGFVITKDRLDEVVPIMKTAMPGRYMIEWDKDDLDTLRILKVDVLALGMLTCLAKAFDLLLRKYGVRKTLEDLGYKDECDEEETPVYDMICRADTIGVFQIESRAQMSMLPRLRPREFYDLIIEVAIVRPGPIQGDMVHPYLTRREAKRKDPNFKVEYPNPELYPILNRTLGIPLFQEQAMQIAIDAAGFSPAKADSLRRAMATFKRSGRLKEFENDMVNGMVDRGYPEDFARRCFNQIKGFGEYGFPQSHAASFALLVYASSWIKTYYPDVFCAAMLNSQPMGFYAPAQLIRDAREHGVTILPVDINRSQWDCTLEEMSFERASVDPRHQSMRDVILTRHAVRLGFRQVKGLAEKDMLEKLVGNRAEKYRSVHDLSLRSGLDRSDLERLADADGFNSIGLNRRQALWAVRGLDRGKQEEDKAGQPTLFALAKDVDLRPEANVALPAMLPGEEVIEDYRYLSLSLKAHPVSFLRERFQSLGITRSVDLLTVPNGQRVTIGGLVLVRQRPGSAKGVIFMTLEDETGVANAIVWPKIFERYRAVVMGARLVKIRGRLQSQSGVIHTVVEHIEDMTPMLGLLQKEARRFGVSERADETLKSSIDHRQKSRTGSNGARQVRDVTDPKRVQSYDIEPGDVMPKGRNFH